MVKKRECWPTASFAWIMAGRQWFWFCVGALFKAFGIREKVGACWTVLFFNSVMY